MKDKKTRSDCFLSAIGFLFFIAVDDVVYEESRNIKYYVQEDMSFSKALASDS